VKEIAEWLDKLGMSEYAQRFAENRIDFSVLPELTDQHLKDLGIALGDRLKMLRAIRELADAIPASPPPELKAPDTAERRRRRWRATGTRRSPRLRGRATTELCNNII
jgi:SAM domain (Sterile alpha motif)